MSEKIKNALLSGVMLFVSFYSFAQDTTYAATSQTSTTAITEQEWYMQKWVWIAGGAALLLIILALISGGKKKNDTRTDRVIITKTVRTESDDRDS